eukprot:365542-Chlamydomonas_euryale.AAC.7
MPSCYSDLVRCTHTKGQEAEQNGRYQPTCMLRVEYLHAAVASQGAGRYGRCRPSESAPFPKPRCGSAVRAHHHARLCAETGQAIIRQDTGQLEGLCQPGCKETSTHLGPEEWSAAQVATHWARSGERRQAMDRLQATGLPSSPAAAACWTNHGFGTRLNEQDIPKRCLSATLACESVLSTPAGEGQKLCP